MPPEPIRQRQAQSPEDYGYYDSNGVFTTPHQRLGVEPGQSAHELDEREAWEEWLVRVWLRHTNTHTHTRTRTQTHTHTQE